jgi:hypothetical protein
MRAIPERAAMTPSPIPGPPGAPAPLGLLCFRFAVFMAVMFWLGGFTFYGAVVIPAAHEVLGTHLEVGFITQRVTRWLNLGGAVSCALLFADRWLAERAHRGIRLLPMVTLIAMTIAQAILSGMHASLDAQLDADRHGFVDHQRFRDLHKIYLNLATALWGVAVVHLWLVLREWSGSGWTTAGSGSGAHRAADPARPAS